MFRWLIGVIVGVPHPIKIVQAPKASLGFKVRESRTIDWFIIGSVVIICLCIFMLLNYSGVKVNLNMSQPKTVAPSQVRPGMKGFVPVKEPRSSSETQMAPENELRTIWSFNDQNWNERVLDGFAQAGDSKKCKFTDPVFVIPAGTRDALILYEGSAGGYLASDDIVNVQGSVIWELVDNSVVATVKSCGPAFTKFSLWVR
jgi:hypothetical protein